MALLGHNGLGPKDGILILDISNQECTSYRCYFWQFGAIIWSITGHSSAPGDRLNDYYDTNHDNRKSRGGCRLS